MSASVLSPLAQPFHPIMGEDVNMTIFNDGVPSLTFQGSGSDFLHTITDDALDEAFPPTAEDAAELEAVEIFVSMMANLSVLEEKEEAARKFGEGLAKRWQARRSLNGKPRAPRHLVNQVQHGEHHRRESKEIVIHDPSPRLVENRMRTMENLKMAKPKTSKSQSKKPQQKQIQQPRRQN